MNNTRRPAYPRGTGNRVRRERYDDDRPNPYLQDAEIARNRPAGDGLTWKKIDLHLHTPASSDYRDPGISYLDILKKAEEKNLDMIAFADHNSVAGYAAMHQEIETLTLLERLGRISADEQTTLNEYRRLLAKLVVLPAFEFTATFGFHILGVFPEGTSVRKLEYLLLNLNVPEDKMLRGAPDVGSTSDVIAAYNAITAAGGMAIAAHANSSNGVAMQGFPFGGQTKIAYTQDANLVCLEVTDLEQTGRRTTAGFYNGIKTEYPRRMHCIQGSDAHSLNTEQADSNNKRLGVGARITEVLMREASWAALREVLRGDDFTRTRPYQSNRAWEQIDAARLKGPNQIVAFHDRVMHPTTRTRHIMQDVVAFANGYGGIIYIGASLDRSVPVQGIERPEDAIRMLSEDVHKSVEPQLDVNFDVKPGGGGRGIIVMNVPGGDNRPYIYSPSSQIYIRDGGNSLLATRAEMIKLIVDAARARGAQIPSTPAQTPATQPAVIVAPVPVPTTPEPRSTDLPSGETPSQPAHAQAEGQSSQLQDRRPWHIVREERRAQARQAEEVQAPEVEAEASIAAQAPATTPLREERRAQAQTGEQRAVPVPETPIPQPAPAIRRPALHDLPPEKIKGQVQPMMPRGAQAPAPVTASVGADAERVAADEVAPEVEQAILQESTNAGEASLPETPSIMIEGAEQSTVGVDTVVPPRPNTRARRRPGSAIPAPETAPELLLEATPTTVEQTTPVEPAWEIALEPEKPGRGRSRRGSRSAKAAEASTEEVAAMPEETRSEVDAAAEIDTPMESTVSAEHLTREEIVEAEPEKPKRGRGRGRGRAAAEEKALEIEAPAAAAAATEAGTEAILVEAEVQPGAQITGELPDDTAAVPAEAPNRRGRARRKSEAVQAAEVAAGIAEATPIAPQEEAPTETGRRRRGRKSDTAQTPSGSAPEASLPPDMPGSEPPDPPSTGVEIIDSQAGQKSQSHTMRDLRNGQTVRNVTKQSARRLWHYAIVQHERGNPELAEVLWHDTLPIGLWRRDERAGALRFDLVSRYPDSSMRVFYGVTDDGVTGPWRELVEKAQAVEYTGPAGPEVPE